MNTILVPTDFSRISTNATRYALAFAKSYSMDRIVLFNSYEIPMINEPSLPAMQVMDFEAMQKASISGLERAKTELEKNADDSITIDCRSEVGGVDASINDICKEVNATLIIIGISGGNLLEERLFGSTATSLANHVEMPLIIVPPEATFKAIDKVVFACDFVKVESSIPVAEIIQLLAITQAELLIVHVDEHKKAAVDVEAQRHVLEGIFAQFNPKFFFVENADFVEGINDFADEHNAGLIITLPRRHGFFDRLFKTHHTKHLAFHTHIPLMCIHGEQK